MRLNSKKLLLAMANECITVNELAKKSEVSKPALSKYTAGKRNPKPATVGKIARALNVRVEELIDEVW